MNDEKKPIWLWLVILVTAFIWVGIFALGDIIIK